MAKKKRSARTEEADNVAEDVDTRPVSSPYAASSTEVRFLKDNTSIRVPKPLLSKYPKLPITSAWDSSIGLDISEDVGHVLVHHLFTNAYQCLRPKGSSSYEKLVAEFTTSVQVYALTRKYEILSLEELAKGEMERLGNGLRFPVVIDLVRSAYPESGADDLWLGSYLKAGLKSLLQNPLELSDCGNTKHQTVSVSDLLFQTLIELVREHASFPAGPESKPMFEEVPTEPEPEPVFEEAPAEPEPEPEFDEAPAQPEPEPEFDEAPAEPEPEPEFEEAPAEPEPVLEPEEKGDDDKWYFTSSKKDKKKGKPMDTGINTDDWSFCDSDSKEAGCERRSEHVFGSGWEDCSSCRGFVRRLSHQLKNNSEVPV